VVTLGEIVQQVMNRVLVDSATEYKLIGVKWYGEGTFHRETVLGERISAKYLTPVRSNTFIYNRLFAWKASFAVVPFEHEGFFVSNEFPQFIVDSQRLLPEYLYLHFMLDSTLAAVSAASVGSAAVSRNRFKEEEFTEFEIIVPPLDVQRAIVAHWRRAQEKLEQARKSYRQLVIDLDERFHTLYRASRRQDVIAHRWLAVHWGDISRWDVKTARASVFRASNPAFVPLGAFAEEATELIRPWEQPHKDWPVYGVNNKEGVFFSHFQKGEDFNAPYKRICQDWFFHNPTRSSVGSLGIVPDVPDDALTSPEYQVWRIKQSLIPGYVAVLINTPFFISLIQFHRVGAVKQRLYVDNLLEIPVPLLTEEEQLQIATARQTALRAVSEAEQTRKVVEAEVEAMILGTMPIPTK
jgi:hypothetical protein